MMSDSSRLSLMIIDSDAAMRSAMKRVSVGNRVSISYSTLEDALVSESKPSLIIADDNVLLAPGDKVALTVLKDKYKCPLIMMTVSSNKRLEAYARQCGADAVLYKPFALDELRKIFWNLVGVEASRSEDGATEPALPRNINAVPVTARGRIADDDAFEALFNALERRQPLQEGFDAFDVIESHLIKRALQACSGNQSHTARFLGITRNTLRKRIKKYGFASITNGESSTEEDD